jgi:hypothetical protein
VSLCLGGYFFLGSSFIKKYSPALDSEVVIQSVALANTIHHVPRRQSIHSRPTRSARSDFEGTKQRNVQRRGSGASPSSTWRRHNAQQGRVSNSCRLNDSGLTTLRINFRGVGQSSGTHDFGKGELDDAKAGLEYLAQNYPNQDITVCGFSFGARMGMEVGSADDRVKYLISIGTPLSKYDLIFSKTVESLCSLFMGSGMNLATSKNSVRW